MPETAQASRGKQAKARIRQAFTKLLREKPIQRIAVKELCQEAGVNRSTFYAHYQDIYDLLTKIEEDMLEILQHVLLAPGYGQSAFAAQVAVHLDAAQSAPAPSWSKSSTCSPV